MSDENVNLIVEEFVDNVKIHPKYITNNMEESILKELKKNKEGICSNHGFIKKNSISICEIGPGKIELSSFHGYINYTVRYSAKVCNPVKDNIVSARVCNINNFGILCTSTVNDDDGGELPVLEIIVPKHSPAIVSSVNLEQVKMNDTVMIQIVGKKYQLYNKKISIIGKIVVDESTRILLDQNIGRGIDIESDEDVTSDAGDESDHETEEPEEPDDQSVVYSIHEDNDDESNQEDYELVDESEASDTGSEIDDDN